MTLEDNIPNIENLREKYIRRKNTSYTNETGKFIIISIDKLCKSVKNFD